MEAVVPRDYCTKMYIAADAKVEDQPNQNSAGPSGTERRQKGLSRKPVGHDRQPRIGTIALCLHRDRSILSIIAA